MAGILLVEKPQGLGVITTFPTFPYIIYVVFFLEKPMENPWESTSLGDKMREGFLVELRGNDVFSGAL